MKILILFMLVGTIIMLSHIGAAYQAKSGGTPA